MRENHQAETFLRRVAPLRGRVEGEELVLSAPDHYDAAFLLDTRNGYVAQFGEGARKVLGRELGIRIEAAPERQPGRALRCAGTTA
jgi:hypothetical protein